MYTNQNTDHVWDSYYEEFEFIQEMKQEYKHKAQTEACAHVHKYYVIQLGELL